MRFKSSWIYLVSLLLVVGVVLGVSITPGELGVGKYSITVGQGVWAAGSVDYTADGTNDNVEFQAALNALPSIGGQIFVLAGNYSFSAAISRTIDNVTFIGVGRASYLARDGVNPAIDVGVRSNWVFTNLRFDAGGIDTSNAKDYSLENIYLGTTYYAYTFASNTVAFTNGTLGINNTYTNKRLEVDGTLINAGPTLTVCASNALRRIQCDYVADGTNDDVEIMAAYNTLLTYTNSGHRGSGKIVLSEGNFSARMDQILFDKSGVILEGQGKFNTTINSSNSGTALITFTNSLSGGAGGVRSLSLWGTGYTGSGIFFKPTYHTATGNDMGYDGYEVVEVHAGEFSQDGLRIGDGLGSFNHISVTDSNFQGDHAGIYINPGGDAPGQGTAYVLQFRGVWSYGGGASGIGLLFSGNSSYVTELQWYGGHLDGGSSGWEIYFESVQRAVLEGFLGEGAAIRAIYLDANSTDNRFISSRLGGPTTGTPGSSVYVAGDNNVFDQVTYAPGSNGTNTPIFEIVAGANNNKILNTPYGSGWPTLYTDAGTNTKVVGTSYSPELDKSLDVYGSILRDSIQYFPTNSGWTESVSNGTTNQFISDARVATSSSPTSKALLYINIRGFGASAAGHQTDWTKKLYFVFGLERVGSDSQAIARVQFKWTSSEGELADMGLGVTVNNYSVNGTSYGSTLGSIDLGTTLSDNKSYLIGIVLDPSVPEVKWYVNGVLKGTQSTATKIPSGAGGETFFVHSIINGITGGVNAQSFLNYPKILQETW